MMSNKKIILMFLTRSAFSHAYIQGLDRFAWLNSFSRPGICFHDSSYLFANLGCSWDGVTDLVWKVGQRVIPGILGSDSNNNITTPDFSPWSYPPVCTNVLETIGSELCVYTNATFSGGRGISIITTPRIAEEFAALPPFLDPAALDGINQFEKPWHTEALPGKGIGVVADRELTRGDLVTAYTPLLIAHVEHEMSTLEREQFFRTAIAQLPPESQKLYLGLATLWGAPGMIVQDIGMANAYEIEIGGQSHLAVYPETSRINHDCAPNSQYYLAPSQLTHTVHASRHIAQDEEITVTYMTVFATTAHRRDNLRNSFHFGCSCARCRAAESSDAALDEMMDLQQDLSNWSSESTATPEMAERLIQMYEEQGLEGFLEDAYGFAAVAYNAVGNYSKARELSRLAIEAVQLQGGPHAPNLELYQGLLVDPRNHWSWKLRAGDRKNAAL